MRDHGIDVIGASTRRLLPGVYATIGFHRRRDGSHGAAVPVKRLDTLARRLQDMTSGLMLRQILDQANGLSTFAAAISSARAASAHPRKALSLREREIASLVCEGRLNKEIAYIVGLSEHTVENHLRRIYAKFSIHNRSALVAAMAAI
jgi:DNA-binding CsgD family transcriptional regulator